MFGDSKGAWPRCQSLPGITWQQFEDINDAEVLVQSFERMLFSLMIDSLRFIELSPSLPSDTARKDFPPLELPSCSDSYPRPDSVDFIDQVASLAPHERQRSLMSLEIRDRIAEPAQPNGISSHSTGYAGSREASDRKL